MEARNAELEAQIEADPDDVRAFAVYADWLQQHGEPRGELIALHIDGLDAEAARLIEKHYDDFLGPIAPHVAHLRWRYGYLDEVHIRPRHGAEAPQTLRDLLHHPSGRFLRCLAVERFDLDEEAELLASAAPATLRELRLGSTGSEALGRGQPLARLWRRIPNVQKLAIHGRPLELGDIELPNVVDVELHSMSWTDAATASITRAGWPRLERLRVSTSSADRHIMGVAQISPELAPVLAELHIAGAQVAAPDLGGAPILRQLRRLGLTAGTFDDGCAEWFAAHPEKLAHLETLDLSSNRMTSAGIEVVQRLARGVVTDGQRAPDDDALYDY